MREPAGQGVKSPTRDFVLTGANTSLKEEVGKAGWWEGGGEEGFLWQLCSGMFAEVINAEL